MTTTPEDIASQALARLGESPISSFDEESEVAGTVARLYETVILSLLSAHDWKFARVREALSEDGAAPPMAGWQRGFLLPSINVKRVGKPLLVYQNGIVTHHYYVQDRWLYANIANCEIAYIERKSEALWPGYFQRLAVEALAADLALPVTENASKDEQHRIIAYGTPTENGKGGLMRQAVEKDDAGDPTRSLFDHSDPITAARFGGGGWF